MGRNRLEDVSCAICMDSLFTKRDDLDDLVPIATCDCGHVFHEPCLLEWFRTQTAQYLAALRAQDIQGRDGSPSLSDAPAECPSCRTECFADPETGEPSIHRLYIDWGGVLDGTGNIGSSPVKSMSTPTALASSRKGKDREVMGLARRAKGITEEVKSLGADSEDEHMEGMLKRGEGLVEDMVSLKALDAVKTYTTSMSEALRQLRHSLESHPLIPGLRTRNLELETTIANMNRQIRLTIPREVKKAVEIEQAKWERRIKKAQDERDTMQHEYRAERVKSKAQRQAMEERERELNRKLAELEHSLKREKEDTEATQNTLRERTKLLKMLQVKADSRKTLKIQLETLQAENERLKASMAEPNLSSSSRRPADRTSLTSQFQDSSERRLSNNSSSHAGPSKRRSQEADESLQVDLPSFADESLQSSSRLLPPRTTSRDLDNYGNMTGPTKRSARGIHPTARIINFDLGDESKSRKRKTSSKYFNSDDQVEDDRGAEKVKAREKDKENVVGNRAVSDGRPDDDLEDPNELIQVIRHIPLRTMDRSELDEGHEDLNSVMVAASSSSEPETRADDDDVEIRTNPAKRNKTNPFATTRHASEKRKDLPSTTSRGSSDHRAVLSRMGPQTFVSNRHTNKGNHGWQDLETMGEVIDLASSSPPTSPRPVTARSTTAGQGIRGAPASGQGEGPGRGDPRPIGTARTGGGIGDGQKGSVVDWLNIRDANGRPKKGVVSGQKVRRKM